MHPLQAVDKPSNISCLNARNKRQEAVKLHRYGCTSHQGCLFGFFYFGVSYQAQRTQCKSGSKPFLLWTL
ncbi:hypothetical protein PVAP13_9NG654501 [Panicum virgatum]|uniref:Uncharacterized protein n=1 Tax=Panicum virgatum TaxID=38727 RepID=A0A8T0N0F4_PANVG|nr:hypothetical protein PVAP13_9NG654501 [Panicum virgatum]